MSAVPLPGGARAAYRLQRWHPGGGQQRSTACSVPAAGNHTWYDDLYHTPLRRFCKVDCSTTTRVPIPNDTVPLPKALGEAFPTPTLFGTDAIIPTLAEISTTGKSVQGGVVLHRRYTVLQVEQSTVELYRGCAYPFWEYRGKN